MSEEERKEPGRPPGEPDWESLRAEHPAPPTPFPKRPKPRPKAEAEEEPDTGGAPPKRSRRKALVALVLVVFAVIRLFERLVSSGWLHR